MADKKIKVTLSDDEHGLIMNYRNLDKCDKKITSAFVRTLLSDDKYKKSTSSKAI